MKIDTKYHGSVEYKTEDVIEFKKGVPGFNELRKFIYFPIKDNEMFSVLHSIEDSEVGFIVTSPFNVIRDYEIKLDDEIIKRLSIEKESDVLVVNTVTLNSKIENITVNMCAPIIINIEKKLGEQLILNNPKYIVKQPLFKGEEGC